MTTGHLVARLCRGMSGVVLLALLPLPAATPAAPPGVLSESQMLAAHTGASGGQFGRSIAASGERIVIGAPGDWAFGLQAGGAFVYVRVGSHWIAEARLVPSDPEAGDEFGESVGISGDTIVVGAHRDDDGADDAGSAYVFTRIGETWLQQAKLLAATPGTNDGFGRSVAIDGDTVLVGSPNDNTPAGQNAGSIHVFTRSGTAWPLQAKLLDPVPQANHRFGKSVAVAGDTLVVGSVQFTFPTTGPPAPAHVFVRDGTSWDLQATLDPGSDPVGFSGGTIGTTVAIQGDTIVMGLPEAQPTGHLSVGAVRIFERTGADWTAVQDIYGRNRPGDNRFGSSVAIDDNQLVVGITRSDAHGFSSGAAVTYRHVGGEWWPGSHLVPSDIADGDFLGNSVAITGDSALVGAAWHDLVFSGAGAVYAFALD
jgi:hypothetical protein